MLCILPQKALGDVSVGEYVRVEGMITTSVPSKETATVAKVTGGAAGARDSLVSPKVRLELELRFFLRDMY